MANYYFKLRDLKAGHNYQGTNPFGPTAKAVDVPTATIEDGPYPTKRDAERAIKRWPADRQYRPVGEIYTK